MQRGSTPELPLTRVSRNFIQNLGGSAGRRKFREIWVGCGTFASRIEFREIFMFRWRSNQAVFKVQPTPKVVIRGNFAKFGSSRTSDCVVRKNLLSSWARARNGEAKISRNLGGFQAKKRNEIWVTPARNSGQGQAAGVCRSGRPRPVLPSQMKTTRIVVPSSITSCPIVIFVSR